MLVKVNSSKMPTDNNMLYHSMRYMSGPVIGFTNKHFISGDIHVVKAFVLKLI